MQKFVLLKLKSPFPLCTQFIFLYRFCTNIYLHGLCILDVISSECCKILALPLIISPPQGHLSSSCAGAQEIVDDGQ